MANKLWQFLLASYNFVVFPWIFCRRGDTESVVYLFRKILVNFRTACLMRFLSNKWCDFQIHYGFKFELFYAGRMRQSEGKKRIKKWYMRISISKYNGLNLICNFWNSYCEHMLIETSHKNRWWDVKKIGVRESLFFLSVSFSG